MRRKAKVDDNQAELVDYFRKAGLSVAVTSNAGDGFPDLVLGAPVNGFPFTGMNFMVEVKDGSKPPSARRLTSKQVEFHDHWQGQIAVIESIDQANEFLELIRRAGW